MDILKIIEMIDVTASIFAVIMFSTLFIKAKDFKYKIAVAFLAILCFLNIIFIIFFNHPVWWVWIYVPLTSLGIYNFLLNWNKT